MKFRDLFAIALMLCSTSALAQVNPGTTPLSGPKGGTGNAFMQFTGPASSLKTYTIPNVTGTLAMLSQIQTWTGAQSFTDGTLVLLGSSSGSSTLKAPSTGGGTATLFAGNDTIVGLVTSQSPTNKTISGSTNVLGGVTMTLGSDATGDVYYRNSSGILTRLGIGSSGNILSVSGGLPSWQPATGGGNVSNTGTPTANQIAQWTNATTVQGVNLASLLTPSGLVAITGTTAPTIAVPAAVKTDQVTGTSNTVAVTPAIQQNHDSAEKAWAFFGACTSSPCTIGSNQSYNISSITRTSAGLYVANFTTAFANVGYACSVMPGEAAAGLGASMFSTAPTVSTFTFATFTVSSTPTLVDPTWVMLKCSGRQ